MEAKSGGKRQTEKLQLSRNAARDRDPEYVQNWIERYKAAVGEPPFHSPHEAFGWLARALLFAADDAMSDPGMPLEARREQLSRLAPQLVKAMEPAKLAQELVEFQRALEELKANAAPVDSREDGGAPARTSLP